MENPYNYHLPVQTDAMFFGRQELLDRIVGGLTQAMPISAAVFGGRRFGKTSLLRKLERDMNARGQSAGGRRLVPWYYDPQAGYPVASSRDFYLLALEALRRALCPDQILFGQVEGWYDEALRLGPVHAFEVCFRLLVQGLTQPVRLVMLVDEAEALLAAPWGDDLRPNLRNLLSNSSVVDSLALVMSGASTFYDQVSDKDSPLENILTRYSLTNLAREQALALACVPNGSLLPADAADQVLLQSGGHPCLIQFIMHELWPDLPDVTAENVQEVAATFSERLNHFQHWTAVLSPLAHQVYRWLIECRRSALYGEVRRALTAPSGSDLQQALDALVYHGVVHIQGRGRKTGYVVAGEMYRDWYLAAQPVPGDRGPLDRTDPTAISVHTPYLAPQESTPPQATHRSFDLEIEVRGPGRYEIQVLEAPTGPVRSAEIGLDLSDPEWLAMLERVQIGDVDAALLTEVGGRLHAFLFPERVRSAFLASREAARRDEQGLCLKLRLHQHELSVLPWELLYDREERYFMALSGNTPLVRTLSGRIGAPLSPAAPPWHLLIVTAAPGDWPALAVDTERNEVLAAVEPLVRAGQVQVDLLEHATPTDLLQAVRGGIHWLHFIGHAEYSRATGNGMLILERADGKGEAVDVETLRHILSEVYARAGTRLRLVFLNACATAQVGIVPGTRGMAQALVEAGVPTSIGMNRPISDTSARAFSAGFYGALAGQGWPFYLAATEGRRRVMVEAGLHGGDWAVPALFMRGDCL